MSWYPGWGSLESVKFWHVFWEIAGIVILAMLVGAEIVAFQYSHRKDYLSDVGERSRVEDQQRQNDAAEKRHSAETESLATKLTQAEKKVADLQSQAIPRRLEDRQKEALVAALSLFKGQKIYIWCSTAAWDATPFATDFLNTFKEAGWEPTDQIRYGIVVGGDAIGIEVLVNPQMADAGGKVSMPSVIALIDTLVALNLMPSPRLGRMPEIEPGTIYFRIGRIPPPK